MGLQPTWFSLQQMLTDGGPAADRDLGGSVALDSELPGDASALGVDEPFRLGVKL